MEEQDTGFLDKREAAFFPTVAEWHKTQKRKYTGLAYTTHLLAVAKEVKKCTRNSVLVAAALGHDLFEDTNCSKEDLQESLLKAGYKLDESKKVVSLVRELTDVYTHEKHPEMNRKLRKKKEAERLRKCSEQAQTIKYADLINNALDLSLNDPGFRQIYLQEMEELLRQMNRGNFFLYSKAFRILEETRQDINEPGAKSLVRDYLNALGEGDLSALLNLFSAKAVVYSPRYGEKPAKDFFPELFEDTASSSLKLYQTFEASNGDICAFFHYDWTLNSGELISFDVCDIFKLDTDRKILELRIIYSL